MQCLTHHIALKAIELDIVYWGIKIDGKDNDHADALSRFKWDALGYIMRDSTEIINKYLLCLLNYPKNQSKKDWQWSEEQKELLRITATRRLIEQKKTLTTRPKRTCTNYNILTKEQFDYLS